VRRRAFLFRSGGLLVTSALPARWLREDGRAFAALPADLPDATWRTLAAVQAHLLPSEAEAPGGAEVNALGYLLGMLGKPDFDMADPGSLIQGAAEIERLSVDGPGCPFADLSEAEREAVLRTFETTEAGRRWLAGLLGTLIEALLADPVYGGNAEGVGWRWLDHNPGFPRPPADKRYFLLGS
jgi:gluconate 2-dehydrogenase gamma chain